MDYVDEARRWAGEQTVLLALERDEELQRGAAALATLSVEELERQGTSLGQAAVQEVSVGMYGRTLVTLVPPRTGKVQPTKEEGVPPPKPGFPSSRLRSGDIVGLCHWKDAATARASKHPLRGVLSSASDSSVVVVLDDDDDSSASSRFVDDKEAVRTELLQTGATLRLDTLGSDVTFQRLARAVGDLEAGRFGAASSVARCVFAKHVDASSSPEGAYAFSSSGECAEEPPLEFDWSLLAPAATAGRRSDVHGEAHVPPEVMSHLRERLYRSDLNEPQVEAIARAMASRDIHLVHGPPGTGKTTTIVELIRQLVRAGLRVLACAPSNVAVDNLVERFAEPVSEESPLFVRLGHPARVSEALLRYTLEARVQASDEAKLADASRKSLAKLQKRIRSAKTGTERWELRQEGRDLAREIRMHEVQAARGALRHSSVVFATLTGAASSTLWQSLRQPLARGVEGEEAMKWFDVVIIDEAAQATEAACWIAMRLGRRVVLAGDHCQLPPTILSEKAAASGLAFTLPLRVVKSFGNLGVSLLTVQHRMCQVIGQWASDALYGGRLVAHEAVKNHYLAELEPVRTNLAVASEGASSLNSAELEEWAHSGLVLVDTAGCEGLSDDTLHARMVAEQVREQAIAEGVNPKDATALMQLVDSRSNGGEAVLCGGIVRAALAVMGLGPSQLVVITPYNGQVSRIRDVLSGLADSPATPSEVAQQMRRVRVSTVDGYQGQEAEMVIISLVRSNRDREVGFLRDHRRINVAVTRARRLCVLLGDTDTVTADPFLRSLVKHCEVWCDATEAHGGPIAQATAEPEGVSEGIPSGTPGALVRSAAMFGDVVDEMSQFMASSGVEASVVPRAAALSARALPASRAELPESAFLQELLLRFVQAAHSHLHRMRMSPDLDVGEMERSMVQAVSRDMERCPVPKTMGEVSPTVALIAPLDGTRGTPLDVVWRGDGPRCVCLDLPGSWSARARKAAHDAAERLGVAHVTISGITRHVRWYSVFTKVTGELKLALKEYRSSTDDAAAIPSSTHPPWWVLGTEEASAAPAPATDELVLPSPTSHEATTALPVAVVTAPSPVTMDGPPAVVVSSAPTPAVFQADIGPADVEDDDDEDQEVETTPEPLTVEAILKRQPVSASRDELRSLGVKERLLVMKAMAAARKQTVEEKGGYSVLEKEAREADKRKKRSEQLKAKKTQVARRLGDGAATTAVSPPKARTSAPSTVVRRPPEMTAGESARAFGGEELPTYERVAVAVRARREAEGLPTGGEEEEEEILQELAKATEDVVSRAGRGSTTLWMPSGQSVRGDIREGGLIEPTGADAIAASSELQGWRREAVRRALSKKLDEAEQARGRSTNTGKSKKKKKKK
jgi:DNA polymerase III delta prime subunit